jgi:hypothetical protein
LWDAFIGEEMRLEQVLANYKDEVDGPDLAFFNRWGEEAGKENQIWVKRDMRKN